MSYDEPATSATLNRGAEADKVKDTTTGTNVEALATDRNGKVRERLPYWASPPRRGKTPEGESAIVVDVAPSKSEKRSSVCRQIYVTASDVHENQPKSIPLLLAERVVAAAVEAGWT